MHSTHPRHARDTSPCLSPLARLTACAPRPQVVPNSSNGLHYKIGPILHRMALVASDSAFSVCGDDQRCRRIRIPPWIRAQFALLTMLSMIRAVPCSQGEFALCPFEKGMPLHGRELLKGRRCRVNGCGEDPRFPVPCSSVDTCSGCPVCCRVVLCTCNATARDILVRIL